MSRTGTDRLDRNDERGARAAARLETERVGWLTTVDEDGTPISSPVWFLWSEHELFVYSLESARARNVADRPRVSFNLDGNGQGGDIVVIEGTARIDESAPSAAENDEYLAKYRPVMDARNWSPGWFASRYRMPLRIAITGYRYW